MGERLSIFLLLRRWPHVPLTHSLSVFIHGGLAEYFGVSVVLAEEVDLNIDLDQSRLTNIVPLDPHALTSLNLQQASLRPTLRGPLS